MRVHHVALPVNDQLDVSSVHNVANTDNLFNVFSQNKLVLSCAKIPVGPANGTDQGVKPVTSVYVCVCPTSDFPANAATNPVISLCG